MLSRWIRLLTLVCCGALVSVVVACSDDNSARDKAAEFLGAFARGDFAAAAATTTSPTDAEAALRQAWSGLQATGLTTRTTKVSVNKGDATIGYHYDWQLPRDRHWTYDGELHLYRGQDGWQLQWQGGEIYPTVGLSQSVSLRALVAPEASVHESDGTTILAPGSLHAVSFDISRLGSASLGQSTAALAPLLAPFVPGLTAQTLGEDASAANGPYSVVTLSDNDFRKIAAQLTPIPGVVVVDQSALLPTDPKFAPTLVEQIRKQVAEELIGRNGWEVVATNENGADAGVLHEVDPDPAPAVAVGISRSAQSAAQAAVNTRSDTPTMMVVLRPSTGEIVAVAQNARADAFGPISTTGTYPPGSTFKMVTSAAAIGTKLATPDTLVDCPGEVTIGDRTIPNYNRFFLGTVTLLKAFAASCNTTFAKLASEMAPTDLTRTARAMGIGAEYTIPGLPSDTGSVPIAPDLTVRTEDGFGQGKVVTNPLGMALVAATVAHGGTVIPQLILGHKTQVKGTVPTVPLDVLEQLRPMMRAVVSEGTASRIAQMGGIYGKTGEAEYNGGSHAWFAGYRGDLAFATLVVGAGSSDHAVEVTADFFGALPPDFGM